MNNPENHDLPGEQLSRWDSLNIDIVEVTDSVVDFTVRPMSESLRRQLKWPPDRPLPQEPQSGQVSP